MAGDSDTEADAAGLAVVELAGDRPLASAVDAPAVGGTYALVFAVTTPIEVEVGALGVVDVPLGDYAYVGSAFGPGGFARVDRHRTHLRGGNDTVHWHVDALTTHPATTFVAAFLCPGVDAECAVAESLPPGPVDGFGSSDCRCRSHLARGGRDVVERAVRSVVGSRRSS
jgi:endonuclease-3